MRRNIATVIFFFFLLAATTVNIQAQEEGAAENTPRYTMAELEQMTAPVALYPDNLLSQVLVASTYPLEVVEADRWVTAHKTLSGEVLTSALQQKTWDDSIKGLVSTPTVLANMSQNLEQTQKLGDAVLAQEDEVMTAIQNLRAKAYKQKTLASNEKQTVTVEQQEANQVIVIESAAPHMIYVPYYDTNVVYGPWAYPAPPYYYTPPYGYAVARGIAFAAGVAIAANFWDDGFDWDNNDINVNVNNNFINNMNNRRTTINGDGQKWHHDPTHRRGVPYANKDLDRKFAPNKAARAQGRDMHEDFRGRLGQTEQRAVKREPSRPPTSFSAQTGSRRDQLKSSPRFSQGSHSDIKSAFSGIGDSGARTRLESSQGRASFQHASATRSFGGSGAFHGGGGRLGGGGGRIGGGRGR